MTTATQIKKELKKLGSSKRAKVSAWFFKTGFGEYGYGDIFWGVSNPLQRKIAKRGKDLPLEQIIFLLKDKIHECRLTALLILVERYKKADEKEKKEIVQFYLKNTKYINNWDLVDISAPKILGEYLIKRNKLILYKLAHSKNLWEQRIAVLATFPFIKNNNYEDSLKIAQILLNHKHDLIHKAVGWMLREVGKKNSKIEKIFLKKYRRTMPRTMLRYAIEKFPEKERRCYLERC